MWTLENIPGGTGKEVDILADQLCMFDDNPEYDAFVDKFKNLKTTDDCYTPPLIYDTVKDWACRKYGIDPAKIVRPFYPGGDYERFDYPDGCVVLDNPPFSIITQICEFYLDRGIAFFLFAPSLTVLSGRKTVMRMNHIICDANITYENGAVVRTAFVTSFGDGIIVQTAPDLGAAVNAAADRLRKEKARELPRYTYPNHVITAALLQRYSKYGIEIVVRKSDCQFISRLDDQIGHGKSIFGGGLLLSDRAAAERAAAERAAAHVWQLSAREKEIVKSLGNH